jgi:predicted nucleic acid-binding protein
MADVVVDTSTVVKWYIPEQHHEQARALRDDS